MEPGSRPGHAVDVTDLTITRPGPRGEPVTVIDGVSFTISPGECLAIIGSSGAGKSVLARALLGLADPAGGASAGVLPGWHVRAERLVVAGREMRTARRSTWRALRGDGVALVLQDALQSLDPLRSIEAEIGETLALGGVPRRWRRAAVLDALEAAGLGDAATGDAAALLPLRSTALSGGMRQRALIASALAGNPRVLVADEPTTALDPETATAVLDEFARVRDAGAALLVVSHDLGAAARIADRIAVLDAGRIVETGPAARLLSTPEHTATRALVAAIPRARHDDPAPPSSDARPDGEGEVAARLIGVTLSYGDRGGRFTGVREVDLVIRRREILGIAGESGAGKTTLARLLTGAEQPNSGIVELAAGARVRVIPQDPLTTFDPRWRVRRIIEATLRRAERRGAWLNRSAPTAAELLGRVGLRPELLDRRPATLSGGERQRVAIARALAARPDILVCDEAVSALDTVTQAGVLALLRGLRDECAVVFISHDHAALASVSDRLIVVREGRVVEQHKRSAISLTNEAAPC